MNSPPTPPPASHVTEFPKFDTPQEKQNGDITTPPMQREVYMDPRFRTPPAARYCNITQRRWPIMNAPIYRRPPLICRSKKTKFIASRNLIEKPSGDRLGFSQEDQLHHEIQPVNSSNPHESKSPHQYKLTQISPKLDSSCLLNNNRSSCASCCGDSDPQLHDRNRVTSCFINMLPVSSPPRSSPVNILAQQAKTHEQPETRFMTPADRLQNPNNNSGFMTPADRLQNPNNNSGFMTPADRLQNPNNNSAQDILIKTRGSANVNPLSSLGKCVDPSRPQKRASFRTPALDCSAPPGTSPQEVDHEECKKKKKAKMAEPELKPKKCRTLSARLPKLELPPEMKPDPAYTPIVGDIAADSVWINVANNRRRPPEVHLDVQAIKKIKKELRKPK